jgi:elongation factor 1-gamma
LLAVAKANNVELEIIETEPAKGLSAEYLKLNKLGKVPTFVGADGYTLHEAIAIAIYSTLQNLLASLLQSHAIPFPHSPLL